MDAKSAKNRYTHRNLSWLAFNERVLEEAADSRNPLMERLKFMAIFMSNLDEFYMVRVAGIKRLLDSQYNRRDRFGFLPQEQFDIIRDRSTTLIRRLYDIYSGFLSDDLKAHRIAIKKPSDLNEEQAKFIRRYFESTLFPIVTPMAVDQGHPFPVLPSQTIAFAIRLSKQQESYLAILPIPKNVPRLLRLPSDREDLSFIFIEEILRDNLTRFFKGYKITDVSLFRLMRDSEISVDEELAPDLLKAIEDEVKRRSWGRVVYLEVEDSCSDAMLNTLAEEVDFNKEEIIRIRGELDLSCLFELISLSDLPQLSFRSYTPARLEYDNIFERIAEGDFIMHVPYESFFPTVDLIRTAASDPDVLAIKMTLYRTNEDSGIIKGLKEAAQNGKQVTVLVEIKARFDEEKNIRWARELEQAGCHVIYGIPGLKIHSKMSLVVRKEEGRIRRYVHLSTGNYNEKTAKIYTDLGYFTCNDDFAKDISDVFNIITGYSVPTPWKRIISSPNDLRQYFFQMIDKEIEFQKRYKTGMIVAKMNSLEDMKMIDKLYEASQEGVRIKLIVRGICCLVPGVKGLSENIEVRSIVGRFLEHTRIYVFQNNTEPRVFLSSADWMTRNLDRRVELLFEIYKGEIKQHLQFVLDQYWKDNVKVRLLQPDKSYVRPPVQGKVFDAQSYFIEHYGG